MTAARKHGTIISYDLNYRESLWKAIGGKKRAQEINRRLAPLVDVMLGNEEDFSAALGFEVHGQDEHISNVEAEAFKKMIETVVEGVSLSGGGHNFAQSQDRHAERLGRHLL